jgi:hypothetical protein
LREYSRDLLQKYKEPLPRFGGIEGGQFDFGKRSKLESPQIRGIIIYWYKPDGNNWKLNSPLAQTISPNSKNICQNISEFRRITVFS